MENIDRVWCSLEDPELEKHYGEWSFSEKYRVFSWTVYIGSIATLLFSFSDLLHLGFGVHFLYALLGRFFIASLALFLLWFVGRKRSPEMLDKALFILSMVIVGASAFIIINVQGHATVASLSETMTVIIFYMLMPQRMVNSLVAALFASVVFLGLRFFVTPLEYDVFAALFLSHILAHLFGILYARSHHLGRRFEFFAMLQEHKIRLQLEEEIEERKKLENELRELSTIDALTGLYNRRFFIAVMTNQINQYKRFGETFSLMLIDIDRFKGVNDKWGHSEGDAVLVRFAELLREHTRLSDVVVRFGGEEFVILAPHHDAESAMILAEKIRMLTEKESLTKNTVVTVSIGVTTYRDGKTYEQLLNEADIALYQAKNGGRNQTVLYREDGGHQKSGSGRGSFEINQSF